MLRKVLILSVVLAAALALGWKFAQPDKAAPFSNAVSGTPAAPTVAGTSSSPTSSSGLLGGSTQSGSQTAKWVPPEGDPVKRYQEAKTKQDRYDIISNFMALGHEKNPFMLVEALKDPDVENRVFAVESSSSLTPEEATHVLRKAAVNEVWDVREMAWSLLAPYPVEHKASVYAEVISNGSNESLEESFSEMGRQPDIQLFDTMVSLSQKVPAQRQARMLKEVQLWLEPGGGDVPQFRSMQEVLSWWQANRQNYDEYMLRIDQ
jgi:HEAT repeat protein